MTYKTRKRIWPVAVVSLAVFGLLAATVALYVLPVQTAQAHGCDDLPTALQQAQCDTEHESAGLDPDNPDHEHDPNQDPVLTGTPLADMSLRVRQTEGPISVADVFEDPDEDDTLTYRASTDNANVANATIAGSQMTVVAGDIRGTARITVTADDGNGGTISTSFTVEVAEAYALTADPMADMMQLMELQDSLPAGDPLKMMLTRVTHDAIYVVESENEGYTALFHLAVAGSADDVTVTVTASTPSGGGITITDSDGLIGAGFNQDDDLEGSLTVKATDQGSRAFEIEGMCQNVGAFALIKVDDKDLTEVAEGAILCERAPIVLPDDRTAFSDLFTVSSYGDWEYDVVTDGFILDVSNGNEHMVNAHHSETGLLSRDEPVVHEAYTLGVSEREMLASLPGGLPRRAKADDTLTRQERNARVEEGQRTIEVLSGRSDVQLTVTSSVGGPAYIRFLDSKMQPFGTDVDEEPMWRGADVVGLDSQGRLDLNLMPKLSAEKALAYDQYLITTPGDPTLNSFLTGLPGDYYQGMFRFFNPCPSVGHHFYVQVYESEGKYLQTTEKIVCVPSPKPSPAGLVFEIDSQKPGEGRLSFEPALNAVGHTVLLIDASNRNIVESVVATEPMFNAGTGRYSITFDNLNNGWTYHIVVIAEGAANQFTADAVKDYGVRWLGEADVPLSTTPSKTPTRQHNLCKIDNVDITALLSDCDAAPMPPAELGAPTNVTATVDDSDPGSMSVTIMWTDGANADRHIAVLFDSNWEFDPDHVAGHQTDGMVTFNNVPAGIYTAAVISIKDDVNGNAEDIDFGVASVTVN